MLFNDYWSNQQAINSVNNALKSQKIIKNKKRLSCFFNSLRPFVGNLTTVEAISKQLTVLITRKSKKYEKCFVKFLESLGCSVDHLMTVETISKHLATLIMC